MTHRDDPTETAANDTSSDRRRSFVARLREQFSHLLEDARYEVAVGIATGRTEIETVAEARRAQAAAEVAAIADLLRDSARKLELRRRQRLYRLASSWAQRVDETARYVRDRSGREVVGDLKGFARRRPGVFVAASFASGLALARFLKSSGERAKTAASRDSESAPADSSYPTALQRADLLEFDAVMSRSS